MVRAIDRKLLRDLWRMRGHVAAIALVAMCGVATFVTMFEAYQSVIVARDDYYRDYHFADVFASAKRAPMSLVAAIRDIDGVAIVDERVAMQVSLDVPGLEEPASGRIISVGAVLNRLHLRRGRAIDPTRNDEILLSEAFADANALQPGDSIAAVINGRRQRLQVVGVAISPEYVNEASPFHLFPDHRRFGVIWMGRAALEAVLDMKGAFNEVTLTLAPMADERKVIAALDLLLGPYGGTGAYGRAEQFSHQFLTDELNQDRVTGKIVPAIFLAVAAFLVHNVLVRVIALQRAQIGVLKAFGYSSATIAWHFVKLASVVVAAGTVAGVALGVRLGDGLAAIYREFFHFPSLQFELGATTLAGVVGIAVATALAGALPAVRRAAALAPAEAMRPEPPARFRPTVVERLGFQRWVPLAARIVLRNLERRPLRSMLSVLGLALATALLVVGRYSLDAIDEIVRGQFRGAMREDAIVVMVEPRGREVLADLRALPGVWRAEPVHMVAARLRSEHRVRRVAVIALEPGGELRRITDRAIRTIAVPADGMVINAKLAEILAVRAGDLITVELLTGRRGQHDLPVAGIVEDYVGLNAYISLATAARIQAEGERVTLGYLAVDAADSARLYKRLKELPAIGSLVLREVMIKSFYDTIARNINVTTGVIIAFACAIAAGLIYNGARIGLSEHSIEFAALRILGFTRLEVGELLVGEQILLTLAAIPAGLAAGYGICAWLASILDGEVYRMPLVLSRTTYVFAIGTVLAAAVASAAIVLAKLARFDLVEALKTRE